MNPFHDGHCLNHESNWIMNWKFSQQGLSSINNIFIILLLAFHCHQHCPFYHLSSHLIQVYLPEIINKMAIRFL